MEPPLLFAPLKQQNATKAASWESEHCMGALCDVGFRKLVAKLMNSHKVAMHSTAMVQVLDCI